MNTFEKVVTGLLVGAAIGMLTAAWYVGEQASSAEIRKYAAAHPPAIFVLNPKAPETELADIRMKLLSFEERIYRLEHQFPHVDPNSIFVPQIVPLNQPVATRK